MLILINLIKLLTKSHLHQKERQLKKKTEITSGASCSGIGTEDTFVEQNQQNTVIPSTTDHTERQAGISSKKRKYDESYLSYGFIPIGNAENPDGKCVVCSKILLNSSLAPAKLKRHLDTNHPHLKNKNISFFERQRDVHQAGVTALQKYAKTDNENATKASFMLSYKIARAGKPHTIAEDFLKPCMTEVVACLLGEDSAKKVATVQCSNNIVSDRIHKISDHIEDELIDRLKESNAFAMQLDESTDVAGLAILLVFVRYPYRESIEEDLFLCAPLEANTTGEEIFKVIDEYMKKNKIDWNKCIDVCSDGAAAMIGKVKGTVSRIKTVAQNCTSSHCILHRHALAVKRVPSDLKQVLDQAVQIVNFVKTRPLQSRLFKKTCEDMKSQHQSLLLHTEVRWLSRGRVLNRLYELRDELKVFLQTLPSPASASYLELLRDERWLMRLAYLADIFDKLNTVSSSLQGRMITIFTVSDKVSSLKEKIALWIECLGQKRYECFPLLEQFLKKYNHLQIATDVEISIREHLTNLKTSLEEYFPEEKLRLREIEWVRNPFRISTKPLTLTVLEYENLIDIKNSSTLQQLFESEAIMNPSQFWIGLKNEYPGIAEKAIIALLPFVTTYRCEAGFSAYAYTKNKFRSRLNAAPDLRIQLSDIKPDFDVILRKTMKRFHSSH
nr:zinc finger BED domain-containing protein 5-like [Maniola hyperantus]